MLEIGVPFSDPIADGPTVQTASQIALDGGACLADTFILAAGVRSRSNIPILVMGYANPFLSYGINVLAHDLAAAGADGLIIPDLLPEHGGEFESACVEHGLHMIRFVAPTTAKPRLAKIGAGARGFVYCVSVTGVTGSRSKLADSLPTYLDHVRRAMDIPRVVGFGISKPDHVRTIKSIAEGAVVASALIDIVRRNGPQTRVAAAAAHVRQLLAAT
jgi:tryptophan synthase alpha chain